MPDRFIYTHVKRLPLFQNMTNQQLSWLCGATHVMRFEPGEWVFRQGEPARGLYMFVSGEAVLTQTGPDGLERQVGRIGENEFVNEAVLFQPVIESASLRVVATSIVLFVDRQQFMTLVSHHPEMRANLGIQEDSDVQFDKTVFKGQRENEHILMITRRHWWVFARLAWILVLLMGLLGILAISAQSTPITIGLLALALILPGVLLIYLYIEWRNDTIIVTDQRIIKIDHEILRLRESRHVIAIESIHEVNTETPSADIFARIFGYGSVELKTSGDAGNIYLHMIPNPEELQDMILEDHERLQEEQVRNRRNIINADIDRIIGEGGAPESPDTGRKEKPDEASHRFGIRWRFPAPMRFTTEEGEVVYRKHYVVWLRHIILPLLIILVAVTLVLMGLFVESLHDIFAVDFAVAAFIFIIGAVWFFWADWDWRNDLYIIDDNTITVIHKRPFLLRNEDDRILLKQVDNVGFDKAGLLRGLFNYGDVSISLIGADDYKKFYDVYDPHEVQSEILRRQSRVQHKGDEAEANRQREIFGEYLSAYHERMQSDYGGQGEQYDTTSEAVPRQIRPSDSDITPVQQPTHDRTRPPGVPLQRPPQPPQPPPQSPSSRPSRRPPVDNTRPPGVPRVRPDE